MTCAVASNFEIWKINAVVPRIQGKKKNDRRLKSFQILDKTIFATGYILNAETPSIIAGFNFSLFIVSKISDDVIRRDHIRISKLKKNKDYAYYKIQNRKNKSFKRGHSITMYSLE